MGDHGIGASDGTAGLDHGPQDGAVPAAAPRAATSAKSAPSWDRFASWDIWPARFVLFALLAMMAMSAMVPIHAGKSTIKTQGFVEHIAGQPAPERERDDDLALYDIASRRIANGENYYDFIVEEHRAANYPVKPGVAVRLPTLAYFNAFVGERGQIVAALVLLAACLMAWWRRLGEEPGGRRRRVLAFALLFLGASLGLTRYFFALHELWSGMLLVLSFGLYRPYAPGGPKWGASLAAAALAVAVREHALPFILLMGAMAAWNRDMKQAAAWTALALAFLGALALHFQMIAPHVMPDDPRGQGWLMLRGLSGWVSNVVLSSNLRFLPGWLAGPAMMLMMLGWAGWKTQAGVFGTFLYLGYGLAFMIAGRADNYYWGFVVAPAMAIGLAFAPMALKSLIRSSSGDSA